jgi:hypothetical protein
MKEIRDCRYSAFISYANGDNDGYYGWISKFADQLRAVLPSRARVKGGIPPPFFGSETPIASGRLSDQLKATVAESFAMIIVVHENYASSEWCLQELAYFQELFGESGRRERLYIVAMSENAIRNVQASANWKRLVPNDDQVWMRFYELADPDTPVPIYQRLDDGRGIPSEAFQDRFETLIRDLSAKIARSANASPRLEALRPGPSETRAEAPRPAPSDGRPGAKMPGVLLGVTTPELAEAVASLRTSLLSVGVHVDALGRDALLGEFPEFEHADLLALPFSQAQPLVPFAPGGHLALQRDAWLRLGKPADSLVWVDMRGVAVPQAARAGHAEFIADVAAQAVEPAGLLTRLLGEKPVPVSDDDDAAAVRIYIESNRNERLLWKPLGEQIKRKWDKLVAGKKIKPPLYVRPRGLPIDEIERHPPLDDADGVVLLWGKKEPRSLLSQIDKVEDRLSGRDLAPCIVAYLMPPQPDPKAPIVAWSWDVLRFQAEREEDIDVVADDTSELEAFLQRILDRADKKRLAASRRAALGTT